jgi:hypothetical protein
LIDGVEWSRKWCNSLIGCEYKRCIELRNMKPYDLI